MCEDDDGEFRSIPEPLPGGTLAAAARAAQIGHSGVELP
jgi:hypothetical protein